MISDLPTKCSLSAVTVTNISQSFTYKMAARISWHRYGTKLRHCHVVYCRRSLTLRIAMVVVQEQLLLSVLPVHVAVEMKNKMLHRLRLNNTESQPQSQPQSQSKPQLQPLSQSQSQSQSRPQPQSHPQSKSQSQSQSRPQPQSQSQSSKHKSAYARFYDMYVKVHENVR